MFFLNLSQIDSYMVDMEGYAHFVNVDLRNIAILKCSQALYIDSMEFKILSDGSTSFHGLLEL